jgi:hypothetical protein
MTNMEIIISAIIIVELAILIYQIQKLHRRLEWKLDGFITLVWHRTLGGRMSRDDEGNLDDFLATYND